MYKPAETTNILLEETSHLQCHHKIASSPVPISGSSIQQIDNQILLTITVIKLLKLQKPHIYSKTPNKNLTIQTTASREQADNSTANTGKVLNSSGPKLYRLSVSRCIEHYHKERLSSCTLAVPLRIYFLFQ
ncbi:hypothetical protein HHI36_015005 [Cryptolaemus montrouzieri]|uniref:Uncharacterized protein n=1 Tax=Cryptolaemus montrouzieri TaxID=559131 RepID=A0ABD2N4F3_9CUCU